MKCHGSKFGRKKEAAIAALLSQRTLEEAARTVGIAVSTLLRWQKDPEFDAAFGAARLRGIRANDGTAPAGLFCRGSDPHEGDAGPEHAGITRVRAAEIIVNHAAKAIEIEDIEARVSELLPIEADILPRVQANWALGRGLRGGCKLRAARHANERLAAVKPGISHIHFFSHALTPLFQSSPNRRTRVFDTHLNRARP
jgi:hypothetical protein